MGVQLLRFNPVFQAYNEEVAWNVVAGDRDDYFGWAVRPFQARDSVVLVSVAAHSDNNLNQSTDLIVRIAPNAPPVGGGGLIRITGVKVT